MVDDGSARDRSGGGAEDNVTEPMIVVVQA
jgi:hypothetical protein